MEPRESRKYIVSGKFIATYIVMIVLFITSVAVAGFYYWKYTTTIKDPTIQKNSETQKVIDEVGQILSLPQNETPTIATVTDPSALQNQAFFAEAKVGDKVLIYTVSNKAILYRPSTHKIIEVAPISVSTEPQSVQPQTSVTPTRQTPVATTTKKR